MNRLAIKLFFLKYYDLIFLTIIFLVYLGAFVYEKKLKGLSKLKSFRNRLKKVYRNVNKGWIIFLILILGFIFRLYKLESPLADWDSWRQADTASVTRIFVSDGINLLYPRYYDISSVQTGIFNPKGYRFVEFPVFNAIHAFFVLNFSFFNLEVWGRLVSIFSSLICIFFIYLIGKRFMGTW